MCTGNKNLTELYSVRLSVILTVAINISSFWKGMSCVLVDLHQMFYHEVGGNISLRNVDKYTI
jgi:hypothetical protein